MRINMNRGEAVLQLLCAVNQGSGGSSLTTKGKAAHRMDIAEAQVELLESRGYRFDDTSEEAING